MNDQEYTKKELGKKAGVYLTNFLTPSAIGALKDLPGKVGEVINNFPFLDKIADSANPWGALGYGVLDIVSEFSDKIKYSPITRLAKLGVLEFMDTKLLMMSLK